MLEKMELYDFIEVARLNKYPSYLVTDVFKRRFSSKTFDISGTIGRHMAQRDSISATYTHVFIENAMAAAYILRAFGHLIQHLSIHFNFLTAQERNEIEQAIENFSSESLNRMDFYGFDKDILCAITKPLKNVEIVTIQGKFRSSEIKGLKLNEIFPNLRHLGLSSIDVFHPVVFDLEFPKLEHFHINLLSSSVEQSPYDAIRNMQSTVEYLLKKNPTIKSLIFNSCHSLKFIKMANDYLPNLKEITANFVALDQYNDEGIHFSNVNKVDFSWSNYHIAKLVSFNQLEDLKLSCSARECIEFIQQNRNVKKLEMFAETFSDQDILKIGNTLPKLVELTLTSEDGIGANPIILLVEKSKCLKKITFQINSFDTKTYGILTKQISKDWTVKKCRDEIVVQKVLKPTTPATLSISTAASGYSQWISSLFT